VLVGNPNTGKTSVFNRLCGLRAKTANFPGTTTEARFGRARIGPELSLEVVDLPGVYGLELDAPESKLASEVLRGVRGTPPGLVVMVADATNLVRNLILVAAVRRETTAPIVVALTMTDVARRRGLSVDVDELSRGLGLPVVPVVARSGAGVEDLRAAIAGVFAAASPAEPGSGHAPSGEDEVWAEQVVARALSGEGADDSLAQRLDRTFTHPILGLLAFAVVMGGLFWTLFALATVPMDLIEAAFSQLGGWLEGAMAPGPVRELLVDGVVSGIAGSLVFLPQICLLFFLLSLLEDTGYLARAAFVMDRVLCRFGLPGQAFVPLLSSHACALPGIMATRLIPDRRDRLATILVAPFMSCSARLPVYVLLTSLLFAERPLLAAAVFAGCYLLGGVAALTAAALLRRGPLTGSSKPMVLELPSYKLPSLRNAFGTAIEQGWAFLRTAGTVIMALCVVLWWLSAYPKSEPPQRAIELREQASALVDEAAVATLVGEAERLEARALQAGSFAGRFGRWVQPAFAPLGLDWQLTVGVLSSFVAREVFVSTMAVLVLGNGDVDPADEGVLATLSSARRDDGSPLFDPASSAALLVFFVLAMQCVSTLVVVRRETGTWKWAAVQLVGMSGIAWIAGAVTHAAVRLWVG
jgi:ferrous iron transport protein B